MNRFPDMFQTVTDRDLFGVNTRTTWLTHSGCIAQALCTWNYQGLKAKVTGKLVAPGNPGISKDSETHLPTVCQTIMKSMSQHLQSDLCTAAATDQPATSPTSAEAGFSCGGCRRRPQQEWEAEEDVKGGTLDRLEDKAARQKEVQYLFDREVRVLHRSGTEDTNGTQPSWPQMDRHQQKVPPKPTLPFTSGVYGAP